MSSNSLKFAPYKNLKPQKPLNSVLVKPAGPDCNLACSYCFYLEKAELFSENKIHRMSDRVLEEMIRQLMTQGEQNISFGWQGGEPTLMGINFFQKAVNFQEKYGYGKTVGNGLQTNGILLDKAWAQFLGKFNFLVGLSLDGPEHIHNKYRYLRSGKGSWDRVHERAKLLLDSGVETNALTVINDYSVQFPEEIYEFHKNLGLTYMQFIPCIETDEKDPTHAAPFSVSPEEFGKFLIKVFDMWQSDFRGGFPTTSIRFFESIFHSYVGVTPPECTLLKSCGIYLVVEHNGDVYSCDFFVEPDWKLGNVLEDRLIDLLNSPKQAEFGDLKSQIPVQCKSCRWLQYCRGGCTKDRIKDPEDQGLSHFCESYKMFYRHADMRMRRLAEDWRRQQQMQNVTYQHQYDNQTNATKNQQVGRNDPCPCGSGKKFKKCCGTGSRVL
jgi:uncharacterized protein